MNVVIFGATGLVGRGVLQHALGEAAIGSVTVIGRRAPPVEHSKLRFVAHRDFLDFEPVAEHLRGVDACFWCLGITSRGMGEADYTRITKDFTMAAAVVLHRESPQAVFCFVSGTGTDIESRQMWARVKARTENALDQVGFPKVVHFRPGAIKAAPGTNPRGMLTRAFTWPLMKALYVPTRLAGIGTTNVEIGAAMIAVSRGAQSSRHLESKEINRVAKDAGYKVRRSVLRRVWTWTSRLALLAFVVLLGESWEGMGARPSGDHLDTIAKSSRYQDGVFVNDIPVVEKIWPALRKWLIESSVGPEYPEAPIPVETRRRAEYEEAPPTGLRVTWLGHSTMLVEIGGRRFLTDPIYGERSSPSNWVGPARFYPPPLALDQLPEIDAVIISHDHFDHLDMTAAKMLPDHIPYVVPLGVGSHLEYWGVDPDRITELDWWQDVTIGDVTLTCTPSRHFSGRSLLGRDATLWAGWALTSPKHRVFFSGDTGMFPGFAEIGKRLGPFDLTMIESGAYDEAWADVHLGPEQAVLAHRMLRGRVMMPVHWGMFDLATHGWTEPVERIMAEAKRVGVRIFIPKPGERFEPAAVVGPIRWWPEVKWETAEEHPIVSSNLPSPEEMLRAAGLKPEDRSQRPTPHEHAPLHLHSH